jgi:hypothetical protein
MMSEDGCTTALAAAFCVELKKAGQICPAA